MGRSVTLRRLEQAVKSLADRLTGREIDELLEIVRSAEQYAAEVGLSTEDLDPALEALLTSRLGRSEVAYCTTMDTAFDYINRIVRGMDYAVFSMFMYRSAARIVEFGSVSTRLHRSRPYGCTRHNKAGGEDKFLSGSC